MSYNINPKEDYSLYTIEDLRDVENQVKYKAHFLKKEDGIKYFARNDKEILEYLETVTNDDNKIKVIEPTPTNKKLTQDNENNEYIVNNTENINYNDKQDNNLENYPRKLNFNNYKKEIELNPNKLESDYKNDNVIDYDNDKKNKFLSKINNNMSPQVKKSIVFHSGETQSQNFNHNNNSNNIVNFSTSEVVYKLEGKYYYII